MSANRGRHGWARAATASAAGIWLALAMGCGSRTSMLDPDVYSGGGSGSGGTSAGTAKAGASTGVDPKRSEAACSKYCAGYGMWCAAELGGRDCVAACTQEVNDGGSQCQSLGIEVVECLTPHFSPTGSGDGCEATKKRGQVGCAAELGKFAMCRPPQAQPPMPQPNPEPPRGGCVQRDWFVAADGSCLSLYECSAGPLLVQCDPVSGGRMGCLCLPPSAPASTSTFEASGDVCSNAALECGVL